MYIQIIGSFNGEKITSRLIYVHNGGYVRSKEPTYVLGSFKEFWDWIKAGYPEREKVDNSAAQLEREAVTTLTFMQLEQQIDQADGDNDGYTNPNNYSKKSQSKETTAATEDAATGAHSGNPTATSSSKVAPTNRGLGSALETPSANDKAQAFEDGVISASSDVLTRKRIVPTLKYDNPNAKGRNFVKFDGFDVENNTLVDRKWNITTFPKALNQLRRMSSALRQNPGFKDVIEVPNQAVYNSTINALQKARVDNITVRIAQ